MSEGRLPGAQKAALPTGQQTGHRRHSVSVCRTKESDEAQGLLLALLGTEQMLSSVTRRGRATGGRGASGLTAPPRAQTGKAAGAVGFGEPHPRGGR